MKITKNDCKNAIQCINKIENLVQIYCNQKLNEEKKAEKNKYPIFIKTEYRKETLVGYGDIFFEKQLNETTYIIVRFFEKNVLINQQVYVPYDIGNHCVDYCFSSAKALNITIKRKNVDSLLSCISNGFFSMYGSDYISVELAKKQLTMLLKTG